MDTSFFSSHNIAMLFYHIYIIFIYLTILSYCFSTFVPMLKKCMSAVGMAMHSFILLVYLTKYYKQPLSTDMILLCTYITMLFKYYVLCTLLSECVSKHNKVIIINKRISFTQQSGYIWWL